MAIKSKQYYHDNFIGNGLYSNKIIDIIVHVLNQCSNKYHVKFKLN